MGTRLGRRVVYMANLPLKLTLPTTTPLPKSKMIREFAIRTIPSATKFEIKSVLRSLYGFDVEEVRTLNMEGKKKKRGGVLLSQPQYKKAYITLRHPLPLPTSLFPVPILEEQLKQKQKQENANRRSRFGYTVVEEVESAPRTKHWLDPDDADVVEEVGRDRWDRERRRGRGKVAASNRRRERALAMEKEKEEGDRGGGGVFPWGERPTLRCR